MTSLTDWVQAGEEEKKKPKGWAQSQPNIWKWERKGGSKGTRVGMAREIEGKPKGGILEGKERSASRRKERSTGLNSRFTVIIRESQSLQEPNPT